MRATAQRLVTIPARLARPAQVSTSRADARSRSLALYRDFYRSAPEVCALYALDIPPSTLRAKFRELFERNRHVDDLAVIDVMLHKGRVDYQETINAWKQTPHIMKLFAEVRCAAAGSPTSLVWERGCLLTILLPAYPPHAASQRPPFSPMPTIGRDAS